MDALEIKWTHLQKVLDDFFDYFVQLARENLDNNGSNASYNLYDALDPINKIVEIGEDYFLVAIELPEYAKYVEKGRGPGKFPPPDVIKNWIEIKPVSPRSGVDGKVPDIKQLTYLISRKIALEGIEPKPFFEPAREEAIRLFEPVIEKAIEDDIYDFIDETVIKEMERTLGGK